MSMISIVKALKSFSFGSGNSIGVTTNSDSLSAYGNYPETWSLPVDVTAPDALTETTVFEFVDIQIYNQFDFTVVVAPGTGLRIYASYDGVTFEEAAGSDMLSVIDKTTGLIVTGAALAVKAAVGSYSIRNVAAKNLRIIQIGAVAVRVRGLWSGAR